MKFKIEDNLKEYMNNRNYKNILVTSMMCHT